MTWKMYCVDVFEAAHGEDSSYGEETFDDQEAAEKAAQERLAQLEQCQPTERSGGQSVIGIQDRVYIVRPDGTKYRVYPEEVQ